MTNFLAPRNWQRRSHGGFSLVELMIAITLGLLIMTGLTSIFVKNSLTRTEIERSNRQLESGRYAMTLLRDDLRMAGFLGQTDPRELIIGPDNPPLGAGVAPTSPVVTSAMAAMPDPCATSVGDLKNAFFFHVQGVDNLATVPTCISDARAGSDVLVIRRVSTCVAGPTLEADCDPVINGAPYFQSSNCATELDKRTDFTQTDYKESFRLDTVLTNLDRNTITCAAQASYRRYLTRIYFVANNNVGSDGIPTLKRAELGAGAITIVPLVEGIETIQFEYGIDANDDTQVDGYSANPNQSSCGLTTANLLTPMQCWLRTYSVKVNLLARNVEASAGYTNGKVYTLGRKVDGSNNVFPPSGTYDDPYKRHAYNATVRLDNPYGRRNP